MNISNKRKKIYKNRFDKALWLHYLSQTGIQIKPLNRTIKYEYQ